MDDDSLISTVCQPFFRVNSFRAALRKELNRNFPCMPSNSPRRASKSIWV
jgi:hypothetical protein